MSLFSLLTLSITKNYPQDEQGHRPLSPFHSCASKNGMDTTELGESSLKTKGLIPTSTVPN